MRNEVKKTTQLGDFSVGIIDKQCLMQCTVERASYGMICLPSFLKIYTGIQAILRFCLTNLNGCNVGITEGMNL
jgi:hypothetical protein